MFGERILQEESVHDQRKIKYKEQGDCWECIYGDKKTIYYHSNPWFIS